MRTVLIFAVSAAAFAQTQVATPAPAPGQDQDKESVIRSTTTVVIAPTTVRDKKGNFIDGLQLQDFQLLDNNKAQKITADVRDEPLSLVVAVQKSTNLDKILPKIQRIGSLLSNLMAGENGEVAVVSFDHRIIVDQDFTNEATKVSEALKNMKPGSTTHAVIDAEMECIRMLKKRPADRRRVLLIIAEKRDKGSQMRVREALTEAEFANVAIYSLDISSLVATLGGEQIPPRPPPIPATAEHVPPGTAATPTTIEQNYYLGNYVPMFVDIFKGVKSLFVDDTLDVFTRFTGGKEYSWVSEKSLEKAVQAISDELHSQYLLSYSPNNPTDGGFHEIKVVVNRPGLEVRTRPGYWRAGTPQ